LCLPSSKIYKIDFKLKTDLLVSIKVFIFYTQSFFIYFGPYIKLVLSLFPSNLIFYLFWNFVESISD
jgi:hypothetical protein